jgi:hypothetical protein
MFRKIALLSSAVALGAGLLFTGGAGHASGSTLDASHYTVACDTMHKGSITFSPPLVTNGTAIETQKFKGTVSGCEATSHFAGDPSVTVVSGSISGSLKGGVNNCASLNGSSAAGGYITITWNTVPALTNKKSTIIVAPFETNGTLVASFLDFGLYRQLDMGGVSVTGAFSGGDNGTSSLAHMLSQEGFDGMFGVCATPGGLKSSGIGSTELFLG